MQLDTFLTIGKQHRVCEDYILSGMEPVPYIILADGCSSAKQTDVGARINCHVAEKLLKEWLSVEPYFYGPDFGKAVIQRAKVISDQFVLDKSALDTTLVVAFYDKGVNGIAVHFYGDGHVFLFNDNTVFEFYVTYVPNAPNYLSYNLSTVRKKDYSAMAVQKTISSNFKLAPTYKIKNIENDCCLTFTYPMVDFKGCLVTSDGIDSFLTVDGKHSSLDSARLFTQFKTTGGEFLKRRARGGLINLNKAGFENYDDLSMGCFLIGE